VLWEAVCKLAKACDCDPPTVDDFADLAGLNELWRDQPANGDITTAAIRYLSKCPPAISGLNGHNQTFAVARSIVYGLNAGYELGYQILQTYYNPRCQPPWTEAELRHKCRDADITPYRKPRGYLLLKNSSLNRSLNRTPTPGNPVVIPGKKPGHVIIRSCFDVR
jgi:hypothetical protein